MIFVKLSIVTWILFFIIRFFVAANISHLEKLRVSMGKNLKMTPGRMTLFLVFLIAIGLTVTSAIWFLFFSRII